MIYDKYIMAFIYRTWTVGNSARNDKLNSWVIYDKKRQILHGNSHVNDSSHDLQYSINKYVVALTYAQVLSHPQWSNVLEPVS